LVLPEGTTYRVPVLAPEQEIEPDVLKKVEEFVKAGVTVVAPKPERTSGLSGYPDSDHELRAVCDRLWGEIDGKAVTENYYGKGRIVHGRDINKVLDGMGVKPDLAFSSPDGETALDYIHRTTGDAELYFVVNRHSRKGINDFEYRYLTELPDRFEQVECSFRVAGKIPQLWDPQTGEIKPVLTYREEKGRTVVPLHLAPEGSVFVVFTDGAPVRHVSGVEKNGQSLFPGNRQQAGENPLFRFKKEPDGWKMHVADPGVYIVQWSDGKKQTVKAGSRIRTIALTGDWNLQFDPEWGGPEMLVVDNLKSWTEFAEAGIKYYSGSAVYRKEFLLNRKDINGKRVLLNLGNLHDMAVVTLNGHRYPLSWTPPYELDVTGRLIAGENKLEIEITNLWPNRLIGDARLPESKRLTKTNINKFEAADAEKLLRVSGLLGPVQLKLIEQKKL
ncbi:MAG: glycosyl hydrolase, partial [Mangrovibacterium sp.]|nr:glycosyl hydrolase [Mangrovibacterium sp.]